MKYKNIIVSIDGSGLSKKIYPYRLFLSKKPIGIPKKGVSNETRRKIT